MASRRSAPCRLDRHQFDDAEFVKAGDMTKLVDSLVASGRVEMAKQVSDVQCERDAAVSLHGNGYEFNFDRNSAGTPANDFSQGGIKFYPAHIELNTDIDGIDIPGTEQWAIDPSSLDVLVENPNDFDYGQAPSPSNALDGRFSSNLCRLCWASASSKLRRDFG